MDGGVLIGLRCLDGVVRLDRVVGSVRAGICRILSRTFDRLGGPRLSHRNAQEAGSGPPEGIYALQQFPLRRVDAFVH